MEHVNNIELENHIEGGVAEKAPEIGLEAASAAAPEAQTVASPEAQPVASQEAQPAAPAEEKQPETVKLLYNTARKRLKLPEYGRNVQKMVEYLRTIEDRQKRNEQAQAVIKVMEAINSSVHLQENYEQKLWDHLFIIADFDLDVDSPYPMPTMEKYDTKPLPIPLQKNQVKAPHYGRNVELIIEKLCSMEPGEEFEVGLHQLAYFMRQQYIIWSKDAQVYEEVIFNDIVELSGGRLVIPEGFRIHKPHYAQNQQGGNQHFQNNKYNNHYRQNNQNRGK